MNRITILIVDDYKLLRDTWTVSLSQDKRFEVVAHTGDGNEAVMLVQQYQPEIVLLDINMTPLDGFTILKLLHKYVPGSKIIGVSMYVQPGVARKMLHAGAYAYVSKGSSFDELVQAILEVKAGNRYVSTDIKNTMARQYTDPGRDTGVSLLSPREIEVIKYVREGYSSKGIALAMNLSVRTVEVHRHNIMKKLNVKNSSGLIRIINAHGL